MRSSTALRASAAVALSADFDMPVLNASLMAVAGLMAFDRPSVSRCENLQLRMAAHVKTGLCGMQRGIQFVVCTEGASDT